MLSSRRFQIVNEVIVGKHVLESLSLGMYSNPFDIFREYIQNATDAIDCAYRTGLLDEGQGEILVTIKDKSKIISIKDNGIGLSAEIAVKKLTDIGNSDKDYESNRGFRGIGRLGGLGYADALYFKTSAAGDAKSTVIRWDCVRLRELLSPSNTEKEDIISVIHEVMAVKYTDAVPDEHYFEVVLDGIRQPFCEQYTAENIDSYISAVAPVDFDGQKFPFGAEIKKHFLHEGYSIPIYSICHAQRKKSIYKPYSRSLSTGIQKRTQTNDYVKSIEFVSAIASDKKPLYLGWLAITDFSGQIRDEELQGIRLRKGNILVGDNTTFARFFPSEGAVANKMFAGEIHILHPDIIPNAKRDDFEPGQLYQELTTHLSKWAEKLNREYRRGTSKLSSAMRSLDKAFKDQEEIEHQISAGAISSDTKRDRMISDLDKTNKVIVAARKELETAIRKGTVDDEKQESVRMKVSKAKESEKASVLISSKIVNADYATKGDLPTSYSKDERKVYQRIIAVIDQYFEGDHETATRLREAIKSELNVKKK